MIKFKAGAAAGMLVLALGGRASSSAGDVDDPTLSSELARRLPPAELQALVNQALGNQLTLTEVRHFDFQFRAIARTRPRDERGLCSASQLTMWFVPAPELTPAGMAPGEIHVSRLPMEIRRSVAAQAYRPGPEALATWRRAVEPDPCESVDPRLPFFVADNSWVAQQALAALHRVVEQAREAPELLNLDCEGHRNCIQQVAALDSAEMESASGQCRGNYFPVEEQAHCFTINFRTDWIHYYSRPYRALQVSVSADRSGQTAHVRRARYLAYTVTQ